MTNNNIPSECNFHKRIAKAEREHSSKEMTREIEKILRSYPEENILEAYSFLNACNFRSIKEVVAFEQERYSKLINTMTEPFEKVEKLSAYLNNKNYNLAWITFEQLLKLIRENKEFAKAVGLEKFEAEFGDCICKLRNHFKVD